MHIQKGGSFHILIRIILENIHFVIDSVSYAMGNVTYLRRQVMLVFTADDVRT